MSHRPAGYPSHLPWPPPPGVPLPQNYPAPPPAPNNWNHPHWNAGSWQYNSRYPAPAHGTQPPGISSAGNQAMNTRSLNPHLAWAPGNGWGMPAQYYNPHKMRNPNPDPTYYATALVDNPLGLTGMTPRDPNRQRSPDDDTPPTPWIWNPPSLVSRESSDQVVISDYGDRQPPRESHSSGRREHASSSPSYRASENPHRSAPSLDNRRGPDGRSYSENSRDPPSNALGRPSDPNSAYHRRSTSQSSPNYPQRSGTYPFATPTQEREPPPRRSSEHPQVRGLRESFTEAGDLRPTFSPRVVRTPDHYQEALRRGSTETPEEAARRTQSSIRDLQRNWRPREPPSSDSSEDTESDNDLPNLPRFSEEPAGLLSPLVGASPSRHSSSSSSRRLGRHGTYPLTHGTHSAQSMPPGSASLGAIPERSSTMPEDRDRFEPLTVPDIPDPHLLETSATRRPRSSTSRTPSSSTSRTSASSTPHASTNTSPHQSANSSYTSVDSSASGRARSSYSSSTGPVAPGSRPNTRRVRMGYWNRRGDYLDFTDKIVYAPPDQANPPDLAGYPTDGFLDEHGSFKPNKPREELPESLPLQGRPPVRPYKSFLVYVERPL
ncbi:hypothetical protein PLICRDRAFT_51315 [Plicaturopsis crispa FD-325 SS-3]|nr:hypothetical protein PLICRDRAFT_51315 [Plicaturopsis crispa FD-325 SS-3]